MEKRGRCSATSIEMGDAVDDPELENALQQIAVMERNERQGKNTSHFITMSRSKIRNKVISIIIITSLQYVISRQRL